MYLNVLNYATTLGKFWHNFNGLELALRLYLFSQTGVSNKKATSFLHGQIGDELDENYITNYMSFSTLCYEYNLVSSPDSKINFDEIVALRDAMAHGRVLGDENGNMSVIKFSKPKLKKVTIQYYRHIKPSQLAEIVDLLNDLTKIVTARIEP